MLYEADDEDELEAFTVQEEGVAPSQSIWELQMYRLAHALGTSAHRLSLELPKYEVDETGSQLRRAAKSVSAHLVFAQASLDETKEHLLYVQDCHRALLPVTSPSWEAADSLGRRLHRFMQQVEAHHRI